MNCLRHVHELSPTVHELSPIVHELSPTDHDGAQTGLEEQFLFLARFP
jgi:hypothetical protein